MKLGFVISGVIVVFLGLLGFFAFRGVADLTTHASSSDKLVKMQLPTDLAPLFVPTLPNGNSARTYSRVLDLYQDHRETLNANVPPPAFIDEMVALLMEAMQQQRVRRGFLDERIPVQPGATPDFFDALESIPGLALMRADELHQEGRTSHALLAAQAVWALGQRAFQDNTRLYNRLQGLTIMLDAGEKMLPWAELTQPSSDTNIRQWMKVIHEIDQVWRAKHELLASLKPHVGDLLNIAQNDEDPSFRVAAILRLGLAKFNPGGRGNKRVIDMIIQEAKNDTDPLIVQAGIAAAGLTREQMHKLY